MKKNVVILVCIVSLIFFIGSISYAQTPPKNWGIGGRISWLTLDDDTVQGVTFDPDATVLFEGIAQYFVNDLFSLEFSVGYSNGDFDAESLGVSVNFGELQQIPVRLTGRFHHWFVDSKATFYGGGGVGYYFNDFDLANVVLSSEPGASVDVDNSFGYHLDAGVEYFVTESWALDLDVKYVWNKADFDFIDSTGVETVGIALNSFIAGVSLKYCF